MMARQHPSSVRHHRHPDHPRYLAGEFPDVFEENDDVYEGNDDVYRLNGQRNSSKEYEHHCNSSQHHRDYDGELVG